jgi:tRNA A-37 threonylcarbamoyl transferase component Bud32
MSVLGPGTVVGGTYRVVRVVGAGAMGEVYEATHARLAGRYAIKVLQPRIAAHKEALERFRREAEITSSLRHPNIVHIMDFNQLPDGAPYLVMEYLEGSDLAARLERTGPPPLDEVVVLVGQIASALEAVHSRGVVHRDLKPGNVCLVPLLGQRRSVVKVVDFGMSKIRAAAGPITRERTLIGTAGYMAPEQAQGRVQEVDARADQFALGVMAYEMLSGRPPFTGDDETAILYQIVHQTPPPLVLAHPATPSRQNALAAVVERALDKDQSRRFPSILAFAEALEDASGIIRGGGRARAIFDSREGVPTVMPLAGAPTMLEGPPSQMTTSSRTAGERLSRPGRRARWPAVVIGAAALLGAGAAVVMNPRSWSALTRATAVEHVSIDLEGLPSGAIVEWDRRPGAPPFTVPRAAKAHHLRVEALGFEPYETEVTADRDRTIVWPQRRIAGTR